MTVLSVLATVFGAIGGVANLPQVYKIFKRKSAKDISLLTYTLLISGAVVWVLYGIEIKNFAIILMNALAFVNFGLIILGWFKYGRN